MLRILAAAWVAFLVILSACKSLGYAHIVWGSIEVFLGGHRQMHFAMAVVMSLLCHLAVYGRRWVSLFNPVMAVLVAGCVVDESLQYFFPARHFNPLDAVASIGGLVVGFALFVFLNHRDTKTQRKR